MKKHEKNNITCFDEHAKQDKSCKNKECRHWHEISNFNNCTINMSNNSPFTLQEVGELFDITRMRVCQIEKQTLQKIKKSITTYLE
jgi:DNA-directed RNA polymerase specialized sigma subunit